MRAWTSARGSREQHSACGRAFAEATPPTPSATLKATAAGGVVQQRRQTTTFELALDRSQLAGAPGALDQNARPTRQLGILPRGRDEPTPLADRGLVATFEAERDADGRVWTDTSWYPTEAAPAKDFVAWRAWGAASSWAANLRLQ
jgi:hypothetical protein